MKRTSILVAAATVAMASCSEVMSQSELIQEEKTGYTPVSITFNGTGNVTKAKESSSDENTIESLKVVLYTVDDDDNLTFESFYSFDAEDISNKKGTIYIDNSNTAEKYHIAAYVNHKNLNQDTYANDWSVFSDEAGGNFQMFGEKTETKNNLTTSKTTEINLIRQCSKVTVNKISLKWTNRANALKDFTLKGIYLMDIEGAFKNIYDITSGNTYNWYNRNGYEKSDLDGLLYDSISDIDVTETSPYTTPHIFYGYVSGRSTFNQSSEWKEGGSRLVIAAEFDGQECFYAVRLHTGTDEEIRNKHFIFDEITITKPGSDHPYSELTDEEAISVTFTVEDWNDVNMGNFVID